MRAVVSRGGRPDLAWEDLPSVHCPTLLIVGEWDEQVLELNECALMRMPPTTEKQLDIVPCASHLFEEPGKIEHVAQLAVDWLARHLQAAHAAVWQDGASTDEPCGPSEPTLHFTDSS